MSTLRFVGRRTELGLISEQVRQLQKGKCRVVNIDGEKGIGKTLLLREACRIYSGDPTIAVAALDFDIGYPHLRHIRDNIARQLGESAFAAYLEVSKEETKLESQQEEYPARLNKIREQADRSFHECYQNLTRRQKVLLTFDTCERVLDTSLLQPFLSWLGSLDNTLVLLAGYRNVEVQADLDSYFGRDAVIPLTLQTLGPEEFKECLTDFAVSAELDESTWAALEFLTGRKPLLLHLAGAWLDRHIDLPDLIRHPLEELQRNATQARLQFERELVSRTRNLASPIDKALLYMTYLISPPQPDLWVALLNIGIDEAERLNEQLQGLFFVRADLTLHDAMRELLEKHVWTFVDRDGSQRNALFSTLESYYSAHESEAPGWDLWISRTTQLHYRLLADFPSAFSDTMRKFYPEIDKYNVYRELVLVELSRGEWKECMTPDQQIQLNNKCAYSFAMQGRKSEAFALCQDTLERQDLQPDLCMEAHAIIALVIEPEAAIEHHKQALAIAAKLDDWRQTVQFMRNIGRAYRKVGQFDEAQRFYELCIEQSAQHGDLAQKSVSQNNLAAVYVQKGLLDLALNQARLALIARQKAGEAPRQSGYIYLTLSAIYQDMSQFETALDYSEQGENAFRRAGDESAQTGAFVHKARIYRRLHKPDNVDSYLRQAIDVFSRYGAEEELCDAHNEKACEHRKRGWELYRENDDREGAIREFKQSEQDFETSSMYAQKVQNWYYLADNLSDLALLYHYWSEVLSDTDSRKLLVRKAEDVVQRTMRLSRKHGRYPLFESRAIEVRGHIAYSRGQYFKAFSRFYLPACALLNFAFGSSSTRFREVFDRVHRRLLAPEVPDVEVRRISLYMIRRWREMRLDQATPGFIATYETIAADYRFVKGGDL